MCKSTTKWSVVLDDGLLVEDTTVAADRFEAVNGFVFFFNGYSDRLRPDAVAAEAVAAFRSEAVISITKKGNK